MKDRLASIKSPSEGGTEKTDRPRRERRRDRLSRRKTLDTELQPSESKDSLIETNLNQKSRKSDSNLTRTNSVSSTEGILGGDTTLRVASPPSVLSDKDSAAFATTKLTSPVKFEPSSAVSRESRLRSPESLRESRVKSPDSNTTREPRVRSPDSTASQINNSPSVRSPISSRSQSRESGLCSPERPPSRPRTPERSTPARSWSSEHGGSRPLSPASRDSSRALSPDNSNQSG